MSHANRKRARVLLLRAVLLMILYAAGADLARAASCTVGVDDMNFGNVDTLTGLSSATTGQVSISCDNVSTTASAVTVCGNFGTGSGGASGSSRTLLSGSNTLRYQLYSGSAGGTPWGSYSDTTLGGPQTIELTPSNGTATGTATLYGIVSGSQATAETGTYRSAFTAADVSFYYQEGTALDCAAPTTATLAQTSFSVAATIAANCLLSVQNLDFGVHGVIDSEVSAKGGIAVTCTPGTEYSISMDGGLTGATDPEKRLMTSGSNTIAYALYADAGQTRPWSAWTGGLVTGTGTGGEQDIAVYGRVEPQAAAAGNYTDTVVVTITYQ